MSCVSKRFRKLSEDETLWHTKFIESGFDEELESTEQWRETFVDHYRVKKKWILGKGIRNQLGVGSSKTVVFVENITLQDDLLVCYGQSDR